MKIVDPIRKKYVELTPEEKVRQFVIRFLQQQCGIPAGYIACEAPVRLYGKHLRSDIWVHNRKTEPVMIIECKRPEVALTEEVLEQVMKYGLLRKERFLVITNGPQFRCWERTAEGGWVEWPRYPSWEDLNS